MEADGAVFDRVYDVYYFSENGTFAVIKTVFIHYK
jgi:hypothetical protein